jgi:hypothetical protein
MSAPTLVTIEHFVIGMLHYKNRVSYYDHMDEPGWPQRVYPGGDKPLLVLSECEAYVAGLLNAREPVKPKAAKPKKPRHTGRPAKVLRPPVAEGGAQGGDNGQA